MTEKQLNRIRLEVNKTCIKFTWCNNFAHDELKQIYSILFKHNLEFTCIDDSYLWIDGKPVTKRQVYAVYYNGEELETKLVVSRYYGDNDNESRCELTAYMS